MNILITWARSYVALSMLKLAYKQKWVNIYIWDSQKAALCFNSNIYLKKVIFPSPKYNFKKFKRFILEYIKLNDINKIYPTCEEVFYFSMIKRDIEVLWTEIFCDNLNKLELLHSKYNFINYCKTFTIKYPDTKIVTNMKDLLKYKGIEKKYIFKYNFSRFSDKIYVNFSNGFYKHIDKISTFKWPLLSQDFIDWEKICSFWIARNGILNSNITYKVILSYKWWSGTFISNIFNKEVNIFVKEIVKKMEFTWFISFDYIDSNNGLYVIESNPRITSWIHLFDDKTILSNIIFNFKNNDTFFSNEDSIRTFLLVNIFFNLKYYFLHRKAFKYNNDICRGSIRIFLYQIYLFIIYFIFSIKNWKTITEISTGDIEYNW